MKFGRQVMCLVPTNLLILPCQWTECKGICNECYAIPFHSHAIIRFLSHFINNNMANAETCEAGTTWETFYSSLCGTITKPKAT
jgi:hypothetical protein